MNLTTNNTVDPTIRSYMLFRHLTLGILKLLVVFMVFFQVVKAVLKLEGAPLLYPYAIPTLLLILCLGGLFLTPRLQRAFNRHLPHLLLLASASVLLIAYHVFFLGETLADILYFIRFYFGMFVIYYGFLFFFLWMDLPSVSLDRWIVSLLEVIILASLLLTAFEFFSIQLGFASPYSFPWIPVSGQWETEDILRKELAGQARAFGLAANSPVLGSFSIFLALLYHAMAPADHKMRRRLITIAAIATALMARSGTAAAVGVLAILALLWHHGLFRQKRMIGASLFGVIALGFIVSNQMDEGGRFTANYWSMQIIFIDRLVDFLRDALAASPLNVLFGFMNLRQFLKPDAVPNIDLVNLYDYAWLAFWIEAGLVGVVTYLILFFKILNTAIPRGDFKSRLAFFTLLISTIHYPVAFWVCSHVVMAVVFAVFTSIRSSESPTLRERRA